MSFYEDNVYIVDGDDEDENVVVEQQSLLGSNGEAYASSAPYYEEVLDVRTQELLETKELIGEDPLFTFSFIPNTTLRGFLAKVFSKNGLIVIVLLFLVIVLGVANRVVYKIQLTPMGNYPLFITWLLTIAYVFLYFSIFGWLALAPRPFKRYITRDMIMDKRAWWKYVLMGLMDATGQIVGIFAARKISGYLLTLLGQGIVPMTMAVTFLFMGVWYNVGQCVGAAVLILGVIITLIPDIIKGDGGGNIYWSIAYFMSSLPSAISFSLKEWVFRDRPDMNIFVVNSFDSGFQLIFALLYFPIVGIPGFGAVPFPHMGTYLGNGAQCLVGINPTHHDDCTGMPWVTILYIVINLSWNISILLLVKRGGAVLSFIAGAISLPIANMAFAVPWPLLGATALTYWDAISLVVVLIGLITYRVFTVIQQRRKRRLSMEEDRRSLPSRVAYHLWCCGCYTQGQVGQLEYPEYLVDARVDSILERVPNVKPVDSDDNTTFSVQ